MCFTKLDKLKEKEIEKNITDYKSIMLENWESLPNVFETSSKKMIGKQEIIDFIEATNQLFKSWKPKKKY